MTLVFATNNPNKVAEIRSALKNGIDIISLKEAGIDKDIPEPHDTLEANAHEKSKTIFEITRQNCFSEDTGLEVEALNGEPGVKSARYAEGEPQYKGIVDKLLDKMKDEPNRKARFRTVISLIINDVERRFEGVCTGRITTLPRGNNGFGYDPIFIPDGAGKTFGEMTLDEKKTYSHRQKALDKLLNYLGSQV